MLELYDNGFLRELCPRAGCVEEVVDRKIMEQLELLTEKYGGISAVEKSDDVEVVPSDDEHDVIMGAFLFRLKSDNIVIGYMEGLRECNYECRNVYIEVRDNAGKTLDKISIYNNNCSLDDPM